jgi:hypothetical protein
MSPSCGLIAKCLNSDGTGLHHPRTDAHLRTTASASE